MHQRDKDRALAEAWDVIAHSAGNFLAFLPLSALFCCV